MMSRKYFKGKNNNELTGSTATLFVSTSNLTESRGTRCLRQESLVRQKNKEIVHEILANFDMEATKQKHRDAKVVEFTWDSNDFSFDSTLSTAKVKARLHELMGTDVIRLNDKRYIDKMVEQLDAERELEIKKKEEALADAEKDRIRKLQREGVIPKTRNGEESFHKKPKTKD